MVYHAGFDLNPDSAAASALRPVKMYEAFQEAGYEVFDLTGPSWQRRRKFYELKKLIKQGVKFDFMYSESATIPVMLRNPNHFPHMFLDLQIFRTLRAHRIPSSVFYRDLYWAYDAYLDSVERPLADAMRAVFRYELAIYRRYTSVIFTPSKQMANEVKQLSSARIKALPPGAVIQDFPTSPSPIRMFYVGGMGAHYRMHELVAAVQQTPSVELTICCAKDQWESVKHEYNVVAPNVHVVHEKGAKLREFFEQANICVVAVEPSHYWTFAVPFKLYEYLGYGKPILATKGTLAGQTVQDNGWGWTVPNEAQQISSLLNQLSENPSEVTKRTEKVTADRLSHTWLQRAKTVRDTLLKG